MKVGTDGVILGAWTNVENSARALDIGTGTGLLALMLAQRSRNLFIDAIDIEPKSARQAQSNFQASSFSSRITSREESFNKLCEGLFKPFYDLIICNPPYFSDSLFSPDRERTIARHTNTLTLEDLFTGVSKIMQPQGRFSIILPADLLQRADRIAEKSSIYPNRLLRVKPNQDKEVKRICIEYSFSKKKIIDELLIIEEDDRHKYSKSYIDLTRDFYLNFK